jgi:hypothetical protein
MSLSIELFDVRAGVLNEPFQHHILGFQSFNQSDSDSEAGQSGTGRLSSIAFKVVNIDRHEVPFDE